MITLLFLASTVIPMVIGCDIEAGSIESAEANLSGLVIEKTTASNNSLMDSPWAMQSHDVRHTGKSPFSTLNTTDTTKWWYKLKGNSFQSSPIIDDEGIIYVARQDLYAIYPNGLFKWKYDLPYRVQSAPAIDENGIIYIGTIWAQPNYLYAIYSNNGTLKWKYNTGNDITSSPAIGEDGTIYFSDWNGNIQAVFPNGTRKWKYQTGNVVTGSPAIGEDGTIYCGSLDDNVYALYPDNGTVKWSFDTGNWVHGSPTIGSDGTIYIGSDNKYLYALRPNGTMKWRCSVGEIWGCPALDEDGIIYVGVFGEKLRAVYPNGTIKWTFEAGGRIWFGSSPAISADGTIYFGTTPAMEGHGSEFIALNRNGAEKWRYSSGWYESSPAIGEDGTVYIVSSHSGDYGRLLAFGELDPNAPEAPGIDGPIEGEIGEEYDYIFVAEDPNGDDIYYYIEWGDGEKENWVGPYPSGEEISVSHTWIREGTYIIKARARDIDYLWGPWGELEVVMPLSYLSLNKRDIGMVSRGILNSHNINNRVIENPFAK